MADDSIDRAWQEEQRRRNQQTQEAWPCFHRHRQQVTSRLLHAAIGRDRPDLTLLGAGNCNDIDLRSLLTAYETVRLVDIDAQALFSGVSRQGLSECPAIVQIGDFDLAGRQDPPASLLNPLADVVASLCVLSQIIEVAVNNEAASHSAVVAAVREVRRAHFSLMISCLRPGGTGLLVTDFVSSTTAPELDAIEDSQLHAFAAACIEAGNFFTGLNPATLLQQIQSDPLLQHQMTRAQIAPPWKWHFGPRVYLVYALQFGRHV